MFQNLVSRRIFRHKKKNVAGGLRDMYNTACRSRCYVTTAKWADIPCPFLGNGSGNTFPLLGSKILNNAILRLYQWKSCVFYVVSAERL
jgi:hypothetical protein